MAAAQPAWSWQVRFYNRRQAMEKRNCVLEHLKELAATAAAAG
jgi:hypothetical protein